MPANKRSSNVRTESLSYDTKTILVVLLLLFFYPVGLIFMWVWLKEWPIWLRIIITLPVFLALFAFFTLLVIFSHAYQTAQMERRIYYMRMPVQQVTPLNPTGTQSIPTISHTY